MQTVSIDRTRHLADQPGAGHNRWHPDIPPIVAVVPGEEVALETRDATDGMALLQERGLTREQAYVLRSVAGAPRISNVVDVPNYVVSALLPEKIFRE